MGENVKVRLRPHLVWVVFAAVFVVVFALRFLLDAFADWPTVVEWLIAVPLAAFTGWAVGAWLRAPGRGETSWRSTPPRS